MRERRLGHMVVVGMLLLSAVASIDPAVEASTGDPSPIASRPVPSPLPSGAVRGTLSVRDRPRPTSSPVPTPEPTPLPTPVPPTGTPFAYVYTPVPSPSPTPEPPPPPPPPPPATAFLSWPVAGNVSQWFSASHAALDIAALCGTPVGAAREGTVVWAGWKDNGGGFVVDIDHGGTLTTYNHLGSIWVSPGQWVGRSQQIGAIGMTGLATGCHLHFGVLIDNVWVNPLAHL